MGRLNPGLRLVQRYPRPESICSPILGGPRGVAIEVREGHRCDIPLPAVEVPRLGAIGVDDRGRVYFEWGSGQRGPWRLHPDGRQEPYEPSGSIVESGVHYAVNRAGFLVEVSECGGIAVYSPDGEVVVTARSLECTPQGRVKCGYGVAVDDATFVLIDRTYPNDFRVVRYSLAGDFLWSAGPDFPFDEESGWPAVGARMLAIDGRSRVWAYGLMMAVIDKDGALEQVVYPHEMPVPGRERTQINFFLHFMAFDTSGHLWTFGADNELWELEPLV